MIKFCFVESGLETVYMAVSNPDLLLILGILFCLRHKRAHAQNYDMEAKIGKIQIISLSSLKNKTTC